FSQSFPYRISNGVFYFLLSRSTLKLAVRDRFRALCCTEFGLGLTTWVYPSGSMTEQLPTTQPTPPSSSSGRRAVEEDGARVGSILEPLSHRSIGTGPKVAEVSVAWGSELSLDFEQYCFRCNALKSPAAGLGPSIVQSYSRECTHTLTASR
ncbi:MAG: hypothetical protein ACK5N9_25175, partial [Pirellula sp.]